MNRLRIGSVSRRDLYTIGTRLRTDRRDYGS